MSKCILLVLNDYCPKSPIVPSHGGGGGGIHYNVPMVWVKVWAMPYNIAWLHGQSMVTSMGKQGASPTALKSPSPTWRYGCLDIIFCPTCLLIIGTGDSYTCSANQRCGPLIHLVTLRLGLWHQHNHSVLHGNVPVSAMVHEVGCYATSFIAPTQSAASQPRDFPYKNIWVVLIDPGRVNCPMSLFLSSLNAFQFQCQRFYTEISYQQYETMTPKSTKSTKFNETHFPKKGLNNYHWYFEKLSWSSKWRNPC